VNFFKRRKKKPEIKKESLLTKEDIQTLDQHIREQRKVRRVPKDLKDDREVLEKVMTDSYFYLADFIKENNFHENREKLLEVWDYLTKGLS